VLRGLCCVYQNFQLLKIVVGSEDNVKFKGLAATRHTLAGEKNGKIKKKLPLALLVMLVLKSCQIIRTNSLTSVWPRLPYDTKTIHVLFQRRLCVCM